MSGLASRFGVDALLGEEPLHCECDYLARRLADLTTIDGSD